MFEDPIFQTYIDNVNQKRKQHFYVIFRVLVYAIRMVLNKIVVYMTDVRISKFTRTSFIKEAAIKDVEHPGQFTVGDGCIKCRNVVSFDGIDFGKKKNCDFKFNEKWHI